MTLIHLHLNHILIKNGLVNYFQSSYKHITRIVKWNCVFPASHFNEWRPHFCVVLWWLQALYSMWVYPRQSPMHSHCWGVPVQKLARSQSLYCESGPAVPFFLWLTVHTRPLVPVLNDFNGAGRKQFIFSRVVWKYPHAAKCTFTQKRERDVKQASHRSCRACACLEACTVSKNDHVILAI